MKPKEYNKDVEVSHDLERVKLEFTPTAESWDILFDVSNNMAQMNFFELVQNAVDSTIRKYGDKASDHPIKITTPNEDHPFLVIEDFGVGMSHEFVMSQQKGLARMGYSDKHDKDNETGFKGHGFKTAFSRQVCNSFLFHSTQNYVTTTYRGGRDNLGQPEVAKLGKMSTPEKESGFKISIPVAEHNLDDSLHFVDKLLQANQLSFEVNGEIRPPFNMPTTNGTITVDGEDITWWLQTAVGEGWRQRRNPAVFMGIYSYAMNGYDDYSSQLSAIYSMPNHIRDSFSIRVPLGFLDVNTARDGISNTQENKDKFKRIADELQRSIGIKYCDLIDTCTTRHDAEEFVNKNFVYYDTFVRETDKVRYKKWRGRALYLQLTTDEIADSLGISADEVDVVKYEVDQKYRRSWRKSSGNNMTIRTNVLNSYRFHIASHNPIYFNDVKRGGKNILKYNLDQANIPVNAFAITIKTAEDVDIPGYTALLTRLTGSHPITLVSSLEKPPKIVKAEQLKNTDVFFEQFEGNGYGGVVKRQKYNVSSLERNGMFVYSHRGTVERDEHRAAVFILQQLKTHDTVFVIPKSDPHKLVSKYNLKDAKAYAVGKVKEDMPELVKYLNKRNTLGNFKSEPKVQNLLMHRSLLLGLIDIKDEYNLLSKFTVQSPVTYSIDEATKLIGSSQQFLNEDSALKTELQLAFNAIITKYPALIMLTGTPAQQIEFLDKTKNQNV